MFHRVQTGILILLLTPSTRTSGVPSCARVPWSPVKAREKCGPISSPQAGLGQNGINFMILESNPKDEDDDARSFCPRHICLCQLAAAAAVALRSESRLESSSCGTRKTPELVARITNDVSRSVSIVGQSDLLIGACCALSAIDPFLRNDERRPPMIGRKGGGKDWMSRFKGLGSCTSKNDTTLLALTLIVARVHRCR